MRCTYLQLLLVLSTWVILYSVYLICRTPHFRLKHDALGITSWPISEAKNTNSNYTELCNDCRYDGIRTTSCYDQVNLLIERSNVSKQDAIASVLNDQPENCKIVRFNISNQLLIELSDIKRPNVSSMYSFHPDPQNNNLSMPCNVSIYVYETILASFLFVEEDMRIKYAEKKTNNNWMADIAIIDSFRTYPCRVYKPELAQIFVVPYPAASHCLYEAHHTKWQNECKHVSTEMIKQKVLNNLEYYKGNENIHLFINTMDIWLIHPSVRNVPLSLTLGPRDSTETSKHIVIPYLNDKESFQPTFIKEHDVGWWTRPRKFSLAYFFGAMNKRMRKSQRIQRLYLLEEVRTNWTSPFLGQLPYVVSPLQDGMSFSTDFIESVYQSSIFCPTLPGMYLLVGIIAIISLLCFYIISSQWSNVR